MSNQTKAELLKRIKELEAENGELLQKNLSKTIELGLRVCTQEEDKIVFENYYQEATESLQNTQKKAIIKELESIILEYHSLGEFYAD